MAEIDYCIKLCQNDTAVNLNSNKCDSKVHMLSIVHITVHDYAKLPITLLDIHHAHIGEQGTFQSTIQIVTIPSFL
jgi:hypothetical protein